MKDSFFGNKRWNGLDWFFWCKCTNIYLICNEV